MNRLNVTDARCEALFASQLQQSDAPTAQAVVEAIRQAVLPPQPLARPLLRTACPSRSALTQRR